MSEDGGEELCEGGALGFRGHGRRTLDRVDLRSCSREDGMLLALLRRRDLQKKQLKRSPWRKESDAMSEWVKEGVT
jgi:hypothetical protein